MTTRAHEVKQDLVDKTQTRTAQVGVIGFGYVGLPLALQFSEQGSPVTGFDIHLCASGSF